MIMHISEIIVTQKAIFCALDTGKPYLGYGVFVTGPSKEPTGCGMDDYRRCFLLLQLHRTLHRSDTCLCKTKLN